MKICISVASKTFLLGEYVALQGGPSLVAATEPRFQLNVNTNGDGRCEGIHRHSPAGQLIRENSSYFQNTDVEFVDPHEGQGGFGASSAQFVLTYLWTYVNDHPFQKLLEGVSPEDLWRSYRQYAGSESHQPSGADVVAQFTGGLTQFSWSPFQVHKYNWPFEDMGFFLISTGCKEKTHDHLKNLQASTFSELSPMARQGVTAFQQRDIHSFVSAVKAFQTQLVAEDLVTKTTQEMIEHINERPEVLAAKGCGALGADVILVLYQESRQEWLRKWLYDEGYTIKASSEQISAGLQMRFDVEHLDCDLLETSR